jgi:tripartite-type tricarboxylate transporter receptor subunit TctC
MKAQAFAASRRALLAGGATLLAAPRARAQAPWPSRPIRIVVPFLAGGATDVSARIVAERLQALLEQPVVIENRAGAGGNIGAEMVAKAAPDGYTLLLESVATAAVNQHLFRSLPFDPQADFTAISQINYVASALLVHPSIPSSSLAAFVAHVRAQPSRLAYGTPGNGTSGHLAGAYLFSRAGVELEHVPYRGTAALMPDLLAGRVLAGVDAVGGYLQHLRAGTLRAVVVTSGQRWFALPEVPTVAESGIADFETVAWFGLRAPAQTPRPIVERLSRLVQDIVKEPAIAQRLREIGTAPVGSSAEAFTAFIRTEAVKWGEIVRISGAQVG